VDYTFLVAFYLSLISSIMGYEVLLLLLLLPLLPLLPLLQMIKILHHPTQALFSQVRLALVRISHVEL
jgi:hypothetical protein